MSKRQMKTVIIVLAVLLLAGVAAYAAVSYGTESDPLVTKSYLDSVLQPQLEQELQTELEEAVSEIRGSSGEFTVLTLNTGDSVACSAGTEVLLRLGTAAACGTEYPVLIDTTTAAELADGKAMQANHLYMVTIQDNGFAALSDGVKVLISGSYTVN